MLESLFGVSRWGHIQDGFTEAILVDIDLCGFLFSWGHTIDVDKLLINDVKLTYERSLTTSNIGSMLESLWLSFSQPQVMSGTFFSAAVE